MAETNIEWTDFSWNPLRARHRSTNAVGHYCEKVSPGCANCYASRMQPRFGLPQYTVSGREAVKPFLDAAVLAKPLGWKEPRKVFTCSMTDLFGDWNTNEDISRVFAVMALASQHTFQVLTKRADRMREFMTDAHRGRSVSQWMAGNGMVPASWGGEQPSWPPPNVWLGVSVEDRARKERIDDLRPTPAAVRFLSCEPLLEDLGRLDLDGIGWVIVGGESGAGARPCRPEWVRSLVSQCREANVPAFVKQMGANVVSRNDMVEDAFNDGESGWPDPTVEYDIHGFREDYQGADCRIRLRDRKGGDPEEWPPDLRVRQWPTA